MCGLGEMYSSCQHRRVSTNCSVGLTGDCLDCGSSVIYSEIINGYKLIEEVVVNKEISKSDYTDWNEFIYDKYTQHVKN